MPKRSKTRKEPEPISPSVSPAKGIELLKRQLSEGEKLLANRPLARDDWRAWERITKDYLIKAFGSDSSNIHEVLRAGKSPMSMERTPAQELERNSANDLQSQLRALASVIEILKTDVEFESTNEGEAISKSNSNNKCGVAQVCMSGHLISGAVDESPEGGKKFCDQCGKSTITKCPSCNSDIQGWASSTSPSYYSNFKPPAFCHNCGKALPWTKERIQAAKELAMQLDGLSDEEKEVFAKSIDEIAQDSPRAALGATRLKKIMAKIGGPIAGAFRDILVDVTSETAKKILWPG